MGFSFYEATQFIAPPPLITDPIPNASRVVNDETENEGYRYGFEGHDLMNPGFMAFQFGMLPNQRFMEVIIFWRLQQRQNARFFSTGPMLRPNLAAGENAAEKITISQFAAAMGTFMQRQFNADIQRTGGRVVFNMHIYFLVHRVQGNNNAMNLLFSIPALHTQEIQVDDQGNPLQGNQNTIWRSCARYNPDYPDFDDDIGVWFQDKVTFGLENLEDATGKDPFGNAYRDRPHRLHAIRIQMLFLDNNYVPPQELFVPEPPQQPDSPFSDAPSELQSPGIDYDNLQPYPSPPMPGEGIDYDNLQPYPSPPMPGGEIDYDNLQPYPSPPPPGSNYEEQLNVLNQNWNDIVQDPLGYFGIGCQTARAMRLHKLRDFSDRMEVWDVPSKNNNCVFAVIRIAMGKDFAKDMPGKSFYSKVRNTLGLFKDQKVTLESFPLLSEMFKIRIEVYCKESILPVHSFHPTYDEKFTIESVRLVRMLVEEGHAFWIRDRELKTCEVCGEHFDLRGYTAHSRRCKEKKNLIEYKCCDCGRVVNIPKSSEIQTRTDLTIERIREHHLCNQRMLSFYQRMIVAKAQKKRGEPSERYVQPIIVPEDMEMIDMTDTERVNRIGRHVLEETQHIDPEQDDCVSTSTTRKRKRIEPVQWRYLCEEQLYAIDIETFADPKSHSRFVPYSVGTWFSGRAEGQEYQEFFGETCMEQLVDDMFFWKREKGIRTILTFNGRGFDYNFIMSALLSGFVRHKKKVNISNITPNGSNIMGFKWGKTRSFDLFSFFMTSLAKVCNEFKIDASLQKAAFPHAFIRSFRDIEYIGSLIPAKYWSDINKIPQFEKRSEYFGNASIANDIWPRKDQFDLRKFSSFYLKKDVLGMVEVYKLFSREIYTRLRLNVCFYLTAPALAYQMFRMNMTDFFIPLPRDEAMQAFFQNAVYGGRVYPRRLAFESSAYSIYHELLEEAKIDNCAHMFWKNQNIFDEVDYRISQRYEPQYVQEIQQDYLCDMDVVSLYPTAMLSFYPCGKMFISNPQEIEILNMMTSDPQTLLHAWDMDKYEQEHPDNPDIFIHLEIGHGIFKVDIQPNTELLEPVLPRKDEKGNTVWDLAPIVNGVYTSVDLHRALQRGYRILKFHYGISFQGIAPVLRKHILKAKAYKEEGDADPENKAAIRSFGKLILNSTYGKFLQKPRFNSTELVEQKDIVHALRNGWNEILRIQDNIFLVDTTKLSEEERFEEIGKPTFMGAFVLAHSRRIMDRIYKAADPCQNCIERLPYYGDTDSLILPACTLPNLEAQDLVVKNGVKQFGQVSNENGDARIIRGFFIAPKLYCFEYITNKHGQYQSFHIRAKGVPKDCLSIEDYENMDMQRWKYLSGELEQCDPDLVRVPFETFLRTGTKMRVRMFKPGELVALREQEALQQTMEEQYLLYSLQALQDFSVDENPQQDLVVPPPPASGSREKTRIDPFNVLLVSCSRSISNRVYFGRDYSLPLNLLFPKHFNNSEFTISCTGKECLLDGYLVKQHQKYASCLNS